LIPLSSLNSIAIQGEASLCDNPTSKVSYISNKLIFNFDDTQKRTIAD
jgi:hypothetical protein